MARIAIIGAGWAGCAAAVAATRRGHHVSLYEAATQPGGRARSVILPGGAVIDNGQHILIGAYTQTLHLMQTVGANPDRLLQRLPLDLRTPDGHGLRLPPASTLPQWDVLRAVLAARGWCWRDKTSLLRAAARWQLQGFRCPADWSVAQLCAPLTATVQRALIAPLCISAFNSAPQDTSGAVFLRVLRDALLAQRGGSDVLIATQPLGDVLPQATVAWLQRQGAHVHLGLRATGLAQNSGGQWRIHTAAPAALADEDAHNYAHAILACPAWEAARLVRQWLTRTDPAPQGHAQFAAASQWAQQAETLQHAPIATVYAWCPSTVCAHLSPMQALADSAEHPAQFVFHHAHRNRNAANGKPQTLLAFVASACQMERNALQHAVLLQAQAQLGLHGLQALQTFIEKRATFVCKPGLQRPAMQITQGLLACGDYVAGDYPATLEGAVRSGWLAGNGLAAI